MTPQQQTLAKKATHGSCNQTQESRAVRDLTKLVGREGGGNGLRRRGWPQSATLFGIVALSALLLAHAGSSALSQTYRPADGDAVSAETGGVPRRPQIDGWSAQAEPSRRGPAGPGLSDGDVDQLLADATDAEERGDVAGAQRLYERIIATDPSSVAADAARQRLGAIYRGETAVVSRETDRPASHDDRGSSFGDGPVTPSPLPDLGPADLGHKGIAVPGAGQTAAMETPAVSVPAPGATAARKIAVMPPPVPQPWRPRARSSARFEQLLRADVGDRVFFGVTSADIGARAHGVLERQAQWLKRYPDLYIVIEGHADEPGSETDNDAMAQLRAETARRLLIGAGIGEQRIDIDVRGRRDRVAVCESADCRAQNRRAVIRLMLVLPARPGDRSSLPGNVNGESWRRGAVGDADPRQVVGNQISRR